MWHLTGMYLFINMIMVSTLTSYVCHSVVVLMIPPFTDIISCRNVDVKAICKRKPITLYSIGPGFTWQWQLRTSNIDAVGSGMGIAKGKKMGREL